MRKINEVLFDAKLKVGFQIGGNRGWKMIAKAVNRDLKKNEGRNLVRSLNEGRSGIIGMVGRKFF